MDIATQIGLETVIPESQFLVIVSRLAQDLSLGATRSNLQWHYLQLKQSIKQLVLLLVRQYG